jgi:hypothetical protein
MTIIFIPHQHHHHHRFFSLKYFFVLAFSSYSIAKGGSTFLTCFDAKKCVSSPKNIYYKIYSMRFEGKNSRSVLDEKF